MIIMIGLGIYNTSCSSKWKMLKLVSNGRQPVKGRTTYHIYLDLVPYGDFDQQERQVYEHTNNKQRQL